MSSHRAVLADLCDLKFIQLDIALNDEAESVQRGARIFWFSEKSYVPTSYHVQSGASLPFANVTRRGSGEVREYEILIPATRRAETKPVPECGALVHAALVGLLRDLCGLALIPGFRCLAEDTGIPDPEEVTWYSYRAEAAPVFICRQDRVGNAVAWETVVYAPKAQPDERVTFVFAGALGYSSEPKTEGFVLEVNGKEALRFDMPAAERWASADGRVELRFESRKTVSVDTFGLFHVTVSRELLTPGQPCRLGVRSLGAGSRRLFGLTPYTDVR